MEPSQQPVAQPVGQQSDGFKPKYRHFHPLDRLWVQNPFDHDIVFQVADEYNRPFVYRLPARKVSELPGGAIATLGLKRIVDELIQNSKEEGEIMRMWDENLRAKYEKDVILRVKQTTSTPNSAVPGEIDLSVKSGGDVPEAEPEPTPPALEEAFPGLNQVAPEPTTAPTLNPLPAPVANGLSDVVGASLPSQNAVVGANNAGHNDEG